MRPSFVGSVLCVLLTRPVAAQRLGLVWVPPAPPFAARDSVDHGTTSRAIGGVLGGAAGFFLGGLAGAAIEKAGGCHGDDLCGLDGAVWGGVIGEGVGMGLGAAAGGSRSPTDDVLISTGIAVAGLAAVLVTRRAYAIVVVPFVQLAVLLGADGRPAPAPSSPN